MVCHNDLNEGIAVRSNTWWEGMVGTRAKLCSETCRDTFDRQNLSHLTDTIETEVSK